MQVMYPMSSIWRSCATGTGEMGDGCASMIFGTLSSYSWHPARMARRGRSIGSPEFYHMVIYALDACQPRSGGKIGPKG